MTAVILPVYANTPRDDGLPASVTHVVKPLDPNLPENLAVGEARCAVLHERPGMRVGATAEKIDDAALVARLLTRVRTKPPVSIRRADQTAGEPQHAAGAKNFGAPLYWMNAR